MDELSVYFSTGRSRPGTVIRLVLPCLLIAAAACSNRQHPGPGTSASATADGIAARYAAGEAKSYREMASQQLQRLPQQSREELLQTLDALSQRAKKDGVQGLEGALSSTIAALAWRDAEGAKLATGRMAELQKSYRVSRAAIRSNALVAYKRPGSPAIFYLPQTLATTLFKRQLLKGTLDVDRAIGEDLCTEAGLAAFELQWGAARAAELRELCAGIGGQQGAGFSGIGALGEAAEMSCVGAHEPTRAERVDTLMRACIGSIGGSSATANPWASDGILSTQPSGEYRADGLYTRDIWRTEEGVPDPNHPSDRPPTFSWLQSTEYYEQQPPPEGETSNEGHARDVEYNREGDIVSVTEYDGDYEDRYRSTLVEFVDGEMIRGTAFDEHGNRTESVDITEDGGYIVTTYGTVVNQNTGLSVEHTTGSQRYNSEGKPVDENGQPTTPAPDSPGMDWGETPQCRAMSVALLVERMGGEIQQLTGDPTVNPNPEAPTTGEDGLDCLGIEAATQVDNSFQCRDEFKSCPLGQMPDASCNCQQSVTAATPEQLCGIYAVCLSGRDDQPNDACCGDVFEDRTAGPGPRPLPVLRSRRDGANR